MTRQAATPLEYSPAPAGPRMKGILGWLIFVGLAVVVFLLLSRSPRSSTTVTIPLSEFDKQLRADNVLQVTIDSDELTGTFRTAVVTPIRGSGTATALARDFRTPLPNGTSGNWSFTEWLLNNRGAASVYVDNQQNLLLNLFVPLVPWIVIFGFIWFFFIRPMRKRYPQPPYPPGSAAAQPTSPHQ
jgi:ATP-dependent Zn protease